MEAKALCSRCGASRSVQILQNINVQQDPELKARLLSGDLFTWTCSECGSVNYIRYPFVYHDPAENLMIICSEAPISAEGLPEGYTGRIVSTAGELIEKVRIADAGMDDIIIEMVKYVTLQEMQLAEAPELRFFKTDGADSDLIFTYPKNGSMEMLAVGFNVYQDCAGITARNPQMHQSAEGLSRVNQDWLRQFFA